MKSLALKANQAYLFNDSVSIKYFTSYNLAEGYIVFTDKPVCFTDARYFYAAKQELSKSNIECLLLKSLEDIANYLKSISVNTIFVDYHKVSVSLYNNFLSFGFNVQDGHQSYYSLRSVKSEQEIADITKACEITQKAFYEAIQQIKVGITELELKEKIDSLCISYGAESSSFDTIVAFGANSAVPHHVTGKTKLTANSVILVDTGCVCNGYRSDLTRTVFFGEPTEHFVNCYNAVLQSNQIAIDNITEGMSCIKADSFARDFLAEHNLSQYFTHSLGHGIGLEVHEYPTLSPKCDDVLKNNMVFSIEPGVYFDGQFGIRIEDTVVLTKNGIKRLFTDDKKLVIL